MWFCTCPAGPLSVATVSLNTHNLHHSHFSRWLAGNQATEDISKTLTQIKLLLYGDGGMFELSHILSRIHLCSTIPKADTTGISSRERPSTGISSSISSRDVFEWYASSYGNEHVEVRIRGMFSYNSCLTIYSGFSKYMQSMCSSTMLILSWLWEQFCKTGSQRRRANIQSSLTAADRISFTYGWISKFEAWCSAECAKGVRSCDFFPPRNDKSIPGHASDPSRALIDTKMRK